MKILITRPRAQSDVFGQQLSRAGYEPCYLPVIDIRPFAENPALENAISNIRQYSWVVFTSVNGVEAFCAQMERQAIYELPEEICVAAIGPKTAHALELHNIMPRFVPSEYVAEAIMPGLGEVNGCWVLLPRAEIARKVLPDLICQAGGVAHEVAVYQTLPANLDPDGLESLKSGVDVITLTSPSIVENFISLIRLAQMDPNELPGNPIYACIGPVTEKAAREAGLKRLIMAREFTTDGLIQAISERF